MRAILTIFFLSLFTSQAQPPMFKMLVKRRGGLLLDTYTGAAAAYSTDKLRTAYSGSCMRVRRSSDNTEQDIGFSGNEIDTAALKTFVGTGGTDDGFIVTYYDQSGSGNNATQTTSANQPWIMNNGVIYRKNGKVAMWLDGLNYFLSVPNIHGSARTDIYYVQDFSDVSYTFLEGGGAGGNYSFVAISGSTSTNIYQNYGTPSLYTNNTLFTGTTRDDVYNALNGYKIATYQNGNVSVWTRFYINGYNTFNVTGYVGDFVIWTSDQSANRSGIVSNMNTRWGVY